MFMLQLFIPAHHNQYYATKRNKTEKSKEKPKTFITKAIIKMYHLMKRYLQQKWGRKKKSKKLKSKSNNLSAHTTYYT
jgi:hypothetical protein